MANMKIENYEGTADTFTFPNNPRVYQSERQMNAENTTFPYRSLHYLVTGGGINPVTISLDGHFNEADSTDKRADFNELGKHVAEARLKKLFFSDDRFMLCVGSSLRETHSGDRVAFIDYVATFSAPVAVVFSALGRSASYDGASWTLAESNQGTITTYIERIDVNLNATESAGETIDIADNSGNGITVNIDGHSAGEVLSIYFVRLVDIGNTAKATRYYYAELKGNEQDTSVQNGKGSKYLQLRPGESIDTFTISGTASYSTVDFTFRDAYLS